MNKFINESNLDTFVLNNNKLNSFNKIKQKHLSKSKKNQGLRYE